ncbi:MAG: S1C family serine protease [Gammaproteobacteria bacterium]
MKMTSQRIFFSTILFCLVEFVFAGTYQYRDEHGHWTFSDKPVPGLELYKYVENGKKKQPPAKDLEAELTGKFTPRTPIEKATLAVVAIETSYTQGSGFFISEDGYLLTNKHIARPADMEKSWEREEETLQKMEEQLKEWESRLMDKNIVHDQIRLDYEACEKDLYRPSYYLDPRYEEKLEDWENHCDLAEEKYFDYEKLFAEYEAEFYSLKNKFEEAKMDLFWKRSGAMFARNFKIFLKDGTEHKADLVAVSEKYDLALLKLNGYKTPALKPGHPDSLPQGAEVYAVGLLVLVGLDEEEKLEYQESQDEEKEEATKIVIEGGLKDAVTSGVVTKIRDGLLITDAAIFPGYSGGPLLDRNGDVVGVNTLFFVPIPGGLEHRGLAAAISIDRAEQEFKKYLQRNINSPAEID